MKTLLNLRNIIDRFIKKHIRISKYLGKFVFCFIGSFILNNITGYSTYLSSSWFILVFALCCGFLPFEFVFALIMLYTVWNVCVLSISLGLFLAAFVLVSYIGFFRISKRQCTFMLLQPILNVIRLPLLIPSFSAVLCQRAAIIPTLLGSAFYYYLQYIHINAAQIAAYEDGSQLALLYLILNGFLTNASFCYNTVLIFIVFFAIFFFKRLNLNYSNEVAQLLGSGIYIVLALVCMLIFKTPSVKLVLTTVFGSLGALILSLVICEIILPLDYSRTEHIEFQDEEYYYFVRAIPKAAIDEEAVKVTRINKRKKIN